MKLKESEQAVKLLEIAPIEVAPEEIRAAVGGAEAEIKGLQVKTGMNGLEVIDATYDYLYSARTPLNTGAQVQEAHATELERALPPAAPDGTDWGKEADRLQGEKNKIEAAEASELGALRTDFEAAKAREQKKHDAERAEIDTDINAKISALEKERAERYGKSAAALTEAIEYARKVGNEEAVRIRGDYKPRVEQVTGELATAQERFRAQEQGEGTRKAIVVARQEAAVSKARAGVITEALERLKKLKVAAAGRLKIPGVIVKDGRIFREQDGGLTPLRKWNTADQVTFCLRLAIMVNGKAGFTVVDDAEHFEQAKFDALVATCKKYAAGEKAQFIVARVSSGALKVEGA